MSNGDSVGKILKRKLVRSALLETQSRSMKNIWRKYWPYLVVLALWVLAAVLICSCDRSLKKENEKLRQELAHAQQYVPLQRDTIRDTVQMIVQPIVELEKVKEGLSKEDQQLLKDMNVSFAFTEIAVLEMSAIGVDKGSGLEILAEKLAQQFSCKRVKR